MVSIQNLAGLFAVISGILIFRGTVELGAVTEFIGKYPLVVIILGFVLFFYRFKIAGKIGTNGVKSK